MNNARRGRAPPRLIITRTKTPPRKHSPLPPVTQKCFTRNTTSVCMASITKQLSPTFPCSTSPASSTSSSPGQQQQHQHPFPGFRCHSNPTSPNFLHPKCFSFSSSPSLVYKRPSSTTRYGRQSPNSPTSPNTLSSSTTASLLIKSPSQPIGLRRSPTRSTHCQHHGPTSLLANQREIKTPTAFSGGNNNIHLIKSQVETSSMSEHAQIQKRILGRTRQLSERSDYNVVHYTSKGNPGQNMNVNRGRVGNPKELVTSLTQTQLSKLERENESKCQEDRHLDQSEKTTWPTAKHSRFKLLRQSFSVESVESPGVCQDFGIRDYLTLTGESIDNEDESSVAGDFNVGLGVRPPRFSIDSLDSTMSLLLEANEAKDKVVKMQFSSPMPQGARRRSDETAGLLRKNNLVLNESTNLSSPVNNADSRNHGDCNHTSSKPSSGKILRKCNSMPHTCLPKIHEGSYTIVGTKIQSEGSSRKADSNCGDHRDMMKASREEGTIEEIDDAEWETNGTEFDQITDDANDDEDIESTSQVLP